MRKKISYLIIFLATFICFQGLVLADELTVYVLKLNYYENSPCGGDEIISVQISGGENGKTAIKFEMPDEFVCEGYEPIGWEIKDSNGNIINTNVIEDKQYNYDFNTTGDELNLYTKWEPKFIPFKDENSCKKDGYIWNKGVVPINGGKNGYCSADNLQYVMCGDAHDIPAQIPALVSMAVNLIKIATPIILIIVSIVTLVKAIMSSREDEIKKAQQSLIRKVIAAVMVFMVISIVQFIVLKVADNKDQKSISACMSCFLNNNCDGKYLKTNLNGEDYCNSISDLLYDNKNITMTLCEDYYNSYEEFSCNIDNYTVIYYSSGIVKSVSISGQTYYNSIYYNNKKGKQYSIKSEFSPKNKNECPTNASIVFNDKTDITITKNEFTCSFKETSDNSQTEEFEVTFDFNGNVIGAKYSSNVEGWFYNDVGDSYKYKGDGSLISVPVATNFKPSNSSECPSDSEVDINRSLGVFDSGAYTVFNIEKKNSKEENVNVFTCPFIKKQTNYEFEYIVTFDFNGNVINTNLNAKPYSSPNTILNYKILNLTSDFKPKNSSECPSYGEYDINYDYNKNVTKIKKLT